MMKADLMKERSDIKKEGYEMKKIAFLFPGQGAQYIGMCKKLCSEYKIADETFEEANDILSFNLKKLCFEGDISELTKTINTQPAVLTASVAAYRVFMIEIGVDAEISAGHSLGEISALCCAGALDFGEALKLVRERARLMQEAVPLGVGSMAAVSGVSNDVIQEVCAKCSDKDFVVSPANYNSPDQTVISGHAQAVKKAAKILGERGAFVIPLRVSGPFHSELMASAAKGFRQELDKINFKPLKRTVIANVTAKPYLGSGDFKKNLTDQITMPVRWVETLEYLQNSGAEMFIELGPKQVLKGLVQKTLPTVKALSYDPETDLTEITNIFADNGKPFEADGAEFIKKCICAAVCTKNSNWDNAQYNKGVVESYKKLVLMRDGFKKTCQIPAAFDIKEAAKLLKTIFDTKLLPETEKRERFDEIIKATGAKEYLKDFIF